MLKYFRCILLCSIIVGCQASGENDTTNMQTAGDADAHAEPKPGSGMAGHEYRSVCLEKESHGGNHQVLSRWLGDRNKAYELGNYHGDFKDKGHRWVIEERVKSERAPK
jgi:hypothetical protein